MVSIKDALELIHSLDTTRFTKMVPLEDALHGVAAAQYSAAFAMPRFDNSAMDGYALKLEDAGKNVTCAEVVYAGDAKECRLHPGECIKIMTGARLPKGTEAVIPIENVDVANDTVRLPADIQRGANMRYMGEDIAKGECIVSKGSLLGPYDIGLLASQGISYVQIYQQLHVSVLSSGQELKSHYENVRGSQLYNSNAPSIEASAKQAGCRVSSVRSPGDDFDSLKAALQNCLASDLVVTTGGASVGDKDYTKEVLAALDARPVFEKVAIKPGKPTSLYTVGSKYVLMLPGNPLAAAVNFELFGKALIAHLQNKSATFPTPFTATLQESVEKKKGRDWLMLGGLDQNGFTPLSLQLPGMVKPLAQADAFIVVDAKVSRLDKGARVKVFLLHHTLFGQLPGDITTKE
ncbi:MAG: gephyrin-like molybdotransferase Glp [Campylobacterota bacterium]